MYLLYIDESGRPERTDSSIVFMLGGIAIRENYWRNFTKDFYDLTKKFYPNLFPSGRLSIPFLKKREEYLKSLVQPTNLNLRKPENRKNRFYITKTLRLFKKYKCTIFATVAIKDDLVKEPKMNWLYPHLLQRMTLIFNTFLEEEKELGLMIIDSNMPDFEEKITFQQIGYLLGNKLGKKCQSIIGLPLFLKSHFSQALLVTNYICGLIQAYYSAKHQGNRVIKTDYSYIKFFWKDLKALLYGDEQRASRGGYISWYKKKPRARFSGLGVALKRFTSPKGFLLNL